HTSELQSHVNLVCRLLLEKRLEIRRVLDRKSTRLNSSHMSISYALFCLKKKRRIAGRHAAPAGANRKHLRVAEERSGDSGSCAFPQLHPLRLDVGRRYGTLLLRYRCGPRPSPSALTVSLPD